MQGDVGATHAVESLTVTSSTTTDLQNVTTRDGGLAVTATTINLNGATLRTDDEEGTSGNAGSVTLTGNVVLTTSVSILTDVSITDGNVTVTGTVNSNAAANNNGLSVTAGDGNVDFQNDIGTGAGMALESLIVVSSGSTDVQNVTTRDGGISISGTTINLEGATLLTDDENGTGNAGSILLDGNVELRTSVSFLTDVSATDGNVTVTGTVDADANTNNQSLSVTAGTGAVDFRDDIGVTKALESLIVVSSGSTDVQNVTTRDGGISITGTTINLDGATLRTDDESGTAGNAGNVSLSGAVMLNTNVLILTDVATGTDGDITLTGSVDGNQTLTLDPGADGNVVAGASTF